MTSPFEKYRDLLLDDYSTAESLQNFVLSLYNRKKFRFDPQDIRFYDIEHFEIFIELASSYREHGEADRDFIALCNEMVARRKQSGRKRANDA